LSFGDSEVFYGNTAVTLSGYANSRTQIYAQQQQLAFVPLPRVTFVYVDGVSPFREEAQLPTGETYISGFTETWDTPAKVREAFVLANNQDLRFVHPKTGQLMGENDLITTETRIQLWDEEGLVDTLICVYYGDLNGDGLVDVLDALLLQSFLDGLMTQEDLGLAAYLAANVNHDSALDATDVKWMFECGAYQRTISQEPTH
jgi:hypothetical protein